MNTQQFINSIKFETIEKAKENGMKNSTCEGSWNGHQVIIKAARKSTHHAAKFNFNWIVDNTPIRTEEFVFNKIS